MTISIRARVSRPSGFVLDVDISCPDRRITALYGASGSGKSTILQLLAGIADISPDDAVAVNFRGLCWHDSSSFVPPHRRGVGYVFQDLQLFPHLSVEGNLKFASSRRAGTVDEEHIIELLDIRHLLKDTIDKLSGGERQRVAIARALFSNPRLLMLDEPLGSVDAPARARILAFLKRFQAELRVPMIYVSHAIEEVNYLADQVHLLDDGVVIRSATAGDFANQLPQGVGEPDAASIISCVVTAQDEYFSLTTADFEGHGLYLGARGYKVGDQLSVSIPARDVSIARSEPRDTSILNLIPTTVVGLHDSGEGYSALVRLRAGRQHLLAQVTRRSLHTMGIKAGDTVYAQIKGVALTTELESRR